MGTCARTPLPSNPLFSHLHCPVGHGACLHPENIYKKVSAVEKTLATNSPKAPNSTSDCCRLAKGAEISRGCSVHVCGAWHNSRCLFPIDTDTNFLPARAEALQCGTCTPGPMGRHGAAQRHGAGGARGFNSVPIDPVITKFV